MLRFSFTVIQPLDKLLGGPAAFFYVFFPPGSVSLPFIKGFLMRQNVRISSDPHLLSLIDASAQLFNIIQLELFFEGSLCPVFFAGLGTTERADPVTVNRIRAAKRHKIFAAIGADFNRKAKL